MSLALIPIDYLESLFKSKRTKIYMTILHRLYTIYIQFVILTVDSSTSLSIAMK